MKRITGILALLLGLSMLTACGGQTPADDPPPATPLNTAGTEDGTAGPDIPTSSSMVCRIVDGAESGQLLLAALDENSFGSVFSLNLCETEVLLDGELADSTTLEDGMVIRVTWQDGSILETYPAQLSGVRSIEAWSLGSEQNPGGSYYDLCGFYLKVLDDLWQKDPALNENIIMAGLDLSDAPGGLTENEKQAVAWRFGELHGVEVITEDFESYYTAIDLGERVKEGPALYEWTDGCLFSIKPHAEDQEKIYSLPTLRFDVAKWRGPLAAYFFYDCTAVWPEFGSWSDYSIGGEMIS